jgi:hypothetical protein
MKSDISALGIVRLMKMGDFGVCKKKNPMNITFKGKMQQT